MLFSQLAEYSGAALSSPADQSGGVQNGPGAPSWEVVLPPDTTSGNLVAACGLWNGSNGGATVTVTQFTDSAGAAMTPHLQQAGSGGVYLTSMWGVTSATGSAGTVAWTQIFPYNGGAGAAATFKPASPVTQPLAIVPQVLPASWLHFPYVTRTLAASGGKPSYSFAVTAGSLPPGMSLSSAGALTASDLTSAGTYGFTVQVTDGNSNTATASQSVTVNSPPPGFPTLSTGSGAGVNLPPGGSYLDPAFSPASNGFNTTVSADWVGPTGQYAQSIGAYSPAVYYVTADGAPAATGQVQAFPCNVQLWEDWGGTTWDGLSSTPLSALRSLTMTWDATCPLTGSWELAVDIWTGYTSTNVPGTGSAQDIMIWVYTSPERAIGNSATLWQPNITINGYTYDVYGTPFGGELIFALQGPGGTGTYAQLPSGTADILGPLLWCVSQGINLGNPPILNSSNFGWEICNTDTYLGSGATQADNFIVSSFAYGVQLASQPVPVPLIPSRPGQRAVTSRYRAGRR